MEFLSAGWKTCRYLLPKRDGEVNPTQLRDHPNHPVAIPYYSKTESYPEVAAVPVSMTEARVPPRKMRWWERCGTPAEKSASAPLDDRSSPSLLRGSRLRTRTRPVQKPVKSGPRYTHTITMI